jgi:thiamine-monophosphate kinase
MAGEFGKWGVEIVGGNTARIPDRIVVDVTLLGDVRPDECLLRSGAQAGDLLCVTGSLGASRAGLELLEGAELGISEFAREEAIRKHCMPSPRLREGQLLGSTGKVTSCMDISDGLWGDAVHIARESDVTVRIDLTRIPVAVSAAQIAGFIGEDPGQFALKGGEDFELLFTVSKASAEDVMLLLRRETDTPVTIIGDIINGDPRVTVQNLGETLNSSPGSFEHFYGEGFDD